MCAGLKYRVCVHGDEGTTGGHLGAFLAVSGPRRTSAARRNQKDTNTTPAHRISSVLFALFIGFVAIKKRTNGVYFSPFSPLPQLIPDQQPSNPTGCLCLSVRLFKAYLSDCNEAAVHKADKTQSKRPVYSSDCTN